MRLATQQSSREPTGAPVAASPAPAPQCPPGTPDKEERRRGGEEERRGGGEEGRRGGGEERPVQIYVVGQ